MKQDQEYERLKELGFQWIEGVGFSFNGLNKTVIVQEKEEEKGEVEDLQLKIVVQTDMSLGRVKLVFNQEILIPNELLESSLKYMMNFAIESSSDGEVTFGRFVKQEDQ